MKSISTIYARSMTINQKSAQSNRKNQDRLREKIHNKKVQNLERQGERIETAYKGGKNTSAATLMAGVAGALALLGGGPAIIFGLAAALYAFGAARSSANTDKEVGEIDLKKSKTELEIEKSDQRLERISSREKDQAERAEKNFKALLSFTKQVNNSIATE